MIAAAPLAAQTLTAAGLVCGARALGELFDRLRQPRVIGEICAGILLGPSLLGRWAPTSLLAPADGGRGTYAGEIAWLYDAGLVLLMMASGAQCKRLFRADAGREVGWLVVLGSGLPFAVALVLAPLLPLRAIAAQPYHPASVLIVLGIAAAVTSIPVIVRIFHDLDILQTRFARLVLEVAIVDDVVLWGLLAVATDLAAGHASPRGVESHMMASASCVALALTALPALVRRATGGDAYRRRPRACGGLAVAAAFAFVAAAAGAGVNLALAAFLAGSALGSAADDGRSVAAFSRVAFRTLVPLYFALVGYAIDFSQSFSLAMCAAVVVGASLVKVMSTWAGAAMAGFTGRDSLNLSIALNARGGPGIVVASVSYEAGIISDTFFTALIVLALVTSQLAGAWLAYVLRRGLPLLGPAHD